MTPAAVPFPENGLSDGVIMLRRGREEDVEGVVAATQDPLIPRHTRVPDRNTATNVREWFESADEERRTGRGVHVLITSTDEGTLLGAVSLHAIDYENRIADIGYWVAAQARGRGVAVRAVRLIARHGSDNLPLERISIGADVENEPSCRVAERAGFTREGILRSWICIKGRQSDAVQFSLLRGELDEVPAGSAPMPPAR